VPRDGEGTFPDCCADGRSRFLGRRFEQDGSLRDRLTVKRHGPGDRLTVQAIGCAAANDRGETEGRSPMTKPKKSLRLEPASRHLVDQYKKFEPNSLLGCRYSRDQSVRQQTGRLPMS
jgi:hypothetical protein